MKPVIRISVMILVCCISVRYAEAQNVTRSTDTVKTSQEHTYTPKPKGPKPLLHEMSGGFSLNSDGWGIYTDIGKVKTNDVRHSDMFNNVRIIHIEFSEKKDPKEYKTTSENGSGNDSYIYGKINDFYALKLGWGYRKMLVGKPDPGSVSIHWVNTIGFALGLIKPYYLNTTSDPSAIKYKDNPTDFLDQTVITGSAGFTKGLGEITVDPGGFFKSALHFDFSTNRKNVIAVETGFNVEYYSSQVQLMANESPTSYFLDLFIAAQFGRRW